MGKDFVGGDFFEANFGRKAFIVIVDDVVLNVDIDGCAAAAQTHLVLRTINFFYSTWLVIELDSACVCVLCVCERDRVGGRETALRPIL